jgi:hypothetical protein
MITLKLRGRHAPTSYIQRIGTTTGRGRDGLIGYEINPETLTDIIDELCDEIVKRTQENGRLWSELLQYKPKPELLPHQDYSDRVKVGGGYGD